MLSFDLVVRMYVVLYVSTYISALCMQMYDDGIQITPFNLKEEMETGYVYVCLS